MPAPQMGLRSTLVRAMAFSDHRAQEETARRPDAGRTRQWQNTGNAVAESDNIVVETAEKIFADLADPQTINNDKKGVVAGAAVAGAERSRLALVLGARRSRRLRREPCRRFCVAERRRPLRGRGSAGRNHARGLAAGAGEDRLARRRDDGRCRPRRRIASRSMPTARSPAAPAACPLPRRRSILPCWRTARTASRSRWSMPARAGSRPGSISATTTATP